MKKSRSLGTILGAVKSLISRMTGVDVGSLVALEDVGGSPGLPAIDGSQLTGISSGATSYSFGNATLDANLLPYVRGYWELGVKGPVLGEYPFPNIAPYGPQCPMGQSEIIGANTDVSGDGNGVTIPSGEYLIAPSYPIFPLGPKSTFLIRFLLKTGTLAGATTLLWLNPLGADYTDGLGIDLVGAGGAIRVIQNATNRISVAALSNNTLHDICLFRVSNSASCWFYLYVNGSYAGTFTTGANVFTVENAPLFCVGRRTDFAAWDSVAMSHLMVASGFSNSVGFSYVSALYNSGTPRVMTVS